MVSYKRIGLDGCVLKAPARRIGGDTASWKGGQRKGRLSILCDRWGGRAGVNRSFDGAPHPAFADALPPHARRDSAVRASSLHVHRLRSPFAAGGMPETLTPRMVSQGRQSTASVTREEARPGCLQCGQEMVAAYDKALGGGIPSSIGTMIWCIGWMALRPIGSPPEGKT